MAPIKKVHASTPHKNHTPQPATKTGKTLVPGKVVPVLGKPPGRE